MGKLADAARRTEEERLTLPDVPVVEQQTSSLRQSARRNVPPGTQELITDLPNGGVVYKLPNGKLAYSDIYYSTSDENKIKQIIDDAASIRTGETATPLEQQFSQQRQEAIGQYGYAPALGEKVLEGLPFVGSYMDELTGAISGPQAAAQQRYISGAMQKEYPVASTTAQMGGLAAGTVLTGLGAGKAIEAVPALSRMAGAAAELPTAGRAITGGVTTGLLGATEGAIYGYGKGTTPESRQSEAIQGGAMGGLIGAPIGLAVPYLGRAYAAFKNRGSQTSIAPEIAAEFGISTEAARMIEQSLESGASFDTMIANIRRAGDQGMIADADEATKVLLDQAASTSPSVASQVRRPVTERAVASSRQLGEEMDVALGAKPQGMQTSYEAIASRSKGARNEAYRDAFNSPINYASPEGIRLEEIFNRIPDEWKREAIAVANRELQWQGKRNQQIMADIADDGTVTFREMPNVQQLHEIKIALNKFARTGDNVDNFGNLKGEGITIASAASELRNALGDAVPAYNKASKIGGDKIREQEALILGGKVLNPTTTRDDVARVLKDASSDERAAAKLGLRQSIDEAMANAKTAATTGRDEAVSESMKILRDLSSRANKTKVELILGKPEADKLFKRLDETRAALELQGATARGTTTAIRTAGREQAQELLEPGLIRSVAELDPVGTVKKLREFLAGTGPAYRQGRSEQMWSEIAGVLTGRRGMDAQQALKYIQQAQQGKRLSKPQEAYTANTVLKYLGAGATFGAANQ
jgi:hypothetical protein